MNIFNRNFDSLEGFDTSNVNGVNDGCAVDPFNKAITYLLKKYVFTSVSDKKKILVSKLRVDSDGMKIYYNDGMDVVIRNKDNINECPVFLISLYCFYNFHLLLDEDAEEGEDLLEKKSIEVEIDLSEGGEKDEENVVVVSNAQSTVFKDKLRYEIDLMSDEIQPDEILFPWISIVKDFQPSKSGRSLNFNELTTIDNLVFLSKNLLQDLIYLKLIQEDASKRGLKIFLQQFESFYMNDFIQKLLIINREKMLKLTELDKLEESLIIDDPQETNIGPSILAEEIEDTKPKEDTGNEGADISDDLKSEVESDSKLSRENLIEHNVVDDPGKEIHLDNSLQQLMLQELSIIKEMMTQEFQNIKFQYSLQQQHLIRLEQQIQILTASSTQSNNNANIPHSFVPNGKYSPFINNSPSLNHILVNNSTNNTNNTLQLLKNATQQQQLQHTFNQNGQKSNVNSPGGLALLSKIASPQPPMSTNGITSMLPHSTASNQQQQQSNLNDKLPSLHESLKMQPTFSEIISDLSNATPNSMRKTVSQSHPENIQTKKRKLNDDNETNDTVNGPLQLDINSMIQMGIEESPNSTALQAQQPVMKTINLRDNGEDDEDALPQNISMNPGKLNDVNNGNEINANYLKKEGKKGSLNENIKYKIYRGHKTIFDVCEEWYVGLPRDKALGITSAETNSIGSDGNEGESKGYNNKYLFSVINKADSDNKNNAILQRFKNTRDSIPRLESIQRLIQLYGWRRWKVTGDSHFFPKRRVVIDYIEDETNLGFKLGRFNVHLDTLENCRKFVVWDLEQFRILNDMSLNNVSILLKNVKKLKSKKIMDGIKKEEENGSEEDYANLRRELFGDDENFSIYSSASGSDGNEVVMAVDGFRPIRKMGIDFIEKFCKVHLFCKS